jgi:hypothetical protein
MEYWSLKKEHEVPVSHTSDYFKIMIDIPTGIIHHSNTPTLRIGPLITISFPRKRDLRQG